MLSGLVPGNAAGTGFHHDHASPAAFLVFIKIMSDKKFYTILIILLAAIIAAAYFCFVLPRGETVSAQIISGGIVKSYIQDRKIIITCGEGKNYDYTIKGICYGPDIKGETFYENYKRDIVLVKQSGASSVRTYRPLAAYNADGSLDKEKTKEMLDAFFNEKITISAGFSYEDMAEGGLLEEYLTAFGGHPALLMIVLGNEYNYHYGQWFTKEEWFLRLWQAVKTAKILMPDRIIATVHGEVPSKEEYEEYAAAGLELVMMNIYRGANFGFARQDWYDISDNMPWVVSEFGKGSKDARGNDVSKLQASSLQTLIRSMEQGYLFMLTDDLQKGEDEITQGAGREDSFGIFDKDGNPKPAAKIVAEEYSKIKGVIYLD